MTSICSRKLMNKKPKTQTVAKLRLKGIILENTFSLQLRTEMLDVKHFSIQQFYCFSVKIQSSLLQELSKSGLLGLKKASEEKKMKDP